LSSWSKAALFLAAVCIAFQIIRRRPHLSLTVYYAVNFVRRWLLPSVRVRVTVAIQLATIAFCLICSYLGYREKRGIQMHSISLPHMKEGFFFLGILSFFSCVNGYFSGYGFFQIMVDLYKTLEILVFYLFLSYTWRSPQDVENAFFWIMLEMFIFGGIELITTERGSTGLNIAMSFFPIFFAWGFYERKKHYWLIIVMSAVMLFFSKTRTYMMGGILAWSIVFVLTGGYYKKSILHTSFFLLLFGGLTIAAYVSATNDSIIEMILLRIAGLADGFESSGGYRLYEIRTALQKFQESPLFGKGFGYTEYLFIQDMGYYQWGDFIHNTYVEILAKTGIFGFLLYGLFSLRHLSVQWRSLQHSRKLGLSRVAAFLLGSFAASLSWFLIYAAAPLNTYGYVFLPGIVGMLYFRLSLAEQILLSEVSVQ